MYQALFFFPSRAKEAKKKKKKKTPDLRLPILQICPRPSQTIGDIYNFEFSLVGKIWDSLETVKSPIIWDFPDI